MQATLRETLSHEWPASGLAHMSAPLLDAADERVVEGLLDGTRIHAMVSMRDLGEGARADRWAPALARLALLKTWALAPLASARVVNDRFFVITTLRPAHGVTVHERMEQGWLGADEAIAVARAALVAAEELHAIGLTASGLRLGTAVLERDGAGPKACLTTYGLMVDRPIDLVAELREIALRTLALVGATRDEQGIRVPPHALPTVVSELLREGAGLVAGHRLASPRELLAALRVATHAPA